MTSILINALIQESIAVSLKIHSVKSKVESTSMVNYLKLKFLKRRSNNFQIQSTNAESHTWPVRGATTKAPNQISDYEDEEEEEEIEKNE